MKLWQLKSMSWGFLIILFATAPLLIREIRKGAITMPNQNAIAANQKPLPQRGDLETRYRKCKGLPKDLALTALNDQKLNNEVYDCENRKQHRAD